MDATKTYEFIGFGAMDVTKPYKFIWFGDIHGPRPYKIVGLRWALISQTPVVSLVHVVAASKGCELLTFA